MNEQERKEAVSLNKARAEAAMSALRKQPWAESTVRAVDSKSAADEVTVLFLSKSDVAFLMGALALHANPLLHSDSVSYTASAARAMELVLNLGEQAFNETKEEKQ